MKLDENTEKIQNDRDLTYLEALIHTGEMLFQENKQSLDFDFEELTKEQIRKSLQLAILKGMKEAIQPNHVMTPDAVSLFMGYLVNKLTEKNEVIRILDPAVGSGNLLTAILNHTTKPVYSFGVEPDETLLKLAYVSANLQQHKIELFHQDSLMDILVDPVDIVVGDLPIGYYPNEEVANRYQLKSKEGMSYTHHLMIEQSLNYAKEGGFLVFLIPNFIFESDQAKQLHSFIKEHAHIYSLLQLPTSMFKEKKHEKSIFILRKKGEGIKAPSQALLAELPTFSNKQALGEMVTSINNWIELNIK
ncbi:class I SAM-dependent methyltransferase [Anaerobacillus sp. CMMVII]|uniref:class I SAM-dependent methyltransferase n=1 Tax=Anaerobacillus sp. CMMVII TaxID=2755588 RepID=UPI0021B71DF8|nr:class I SAM-dependent methyltransferase [Anaerobacillus sp. CMMVII]MCT8137372.1 class I SAM-dependent methyltransferase [Anaerobacillus sp. CMMVII]